MPTLVQFDFPMQGPWGDEMAAAYRELAELIAAAPGLRWKVWTENSETGEGGGIYLFDDDATAAAYVAEHRRACRASASPTSGRRRFT
jgi:hypothetical protein